MTDAEVYAEAALVGARWLEPVRVNAPVPRPIRSVAVIGGTKFDKPATNAWLTALNAKYPDITVRTGTAQGAELYVAERAAELGLTLFTPEPNEFLGPDCQVTEALLGADAVVVVGSSTGKRAAIALAVHKRVDGWRDSGRPLVLVGGSDAA